MKNKAIIDAKEPKDMKQKAKKQLEKRGFTVETKALDQGDYLYPHQSVIIERKEKSDLASSIQDRRISQQADRMAANHDHLYVLTEGDVYDLDYSNLHPNSIRGQLISLAVKRDIKMIPTKDKDGTAYAIARLFERYKDEEHQQSTEYLKTHDTGEIENTTKAMLMQVDGLSEKKAGRLIDETSLFNDGLARFGSLVFSDPTYVKEEIERLDGFGPKTAEKIIAAFHGQ